MSDAFFVQVVDSYKGLTGSASGLVHYQEIDTNLKNRSVTISELIYLQAGQDVGLWFTSLAPGFTIYVDTDFSIELVSTDVGYLVTGTYIPTGTV